MSNVLLAGEIGRLDAASSVAGTDYLVVLNAQGQLKKGTATQVAAGGDDDKVKVSSDDTTGGYLEDKISVGTGLALSTTSPGGNEVRNIALDATLVALAAYNTNGILTQTAADTFTGRTITGTAAQIDVANGDGVSGNPTLSMSATYAGQASITTLGTIATGVWNGTVITEAYVRPRESMIVAASDETTALTVGTAKVTFRMPYGFTLSDVRASVTTAPTDATLTVDIKEGGVSILSTLITIDSGEKTSTTAAVPPVISDANLADDAEMTVDITQIGSTIAGAGLKVYLIGVRA